MCQMVIRNVEVRDQGPGSGGSAVILNRVVIKGFSGKGLGEKKPEEDEGTSHARARDKMG